MPCIRSTYQTKRKIPYIDIQLPVAVVQWHATKSVYYPPSFVFCCIYNFPTPRLALEPECQQVGKPFAKQLKFNLHWDAAWEEACL